MTPSDLETPYLHFAVIPNPDLPITTNFF